MLVGVGVSTDAAPFAAPCVATVAALAPRAFVVVFVVVVFVVVVLMRAV